MNETPKALRTHIGIFGNTNSGKSSLFNKILNQDLAIVSEEKGTTTDPVLKAMELLPFGPVVLVDTAGLFDGTVMEGLRGNKTRQILKEMDYAILAVDYKSFSSKSFLTLKKLLLEKNIPFTVVFTKSDLLSHEEKELLKKEYPKAAFVSIFDEESIKELRRILSSRLSAFKKEEQSLLSGIAKGGDHVVLVAPIDSEAPKGRLILPQVQLIRACLDAGAFCHVSRETELEKMLQSLERVELVVTDSQAFAQVLPLVPKEVPLTSFSMLLARQKGDLAMFFQGAKAVESLKDGSKILMAEACTHNTSHEDIGGVKIPTLLKKHTGKNLEFEFSSGFVFPDELSSYDLVIHCGGCMITKKAMESRSHVAKENQVPITNYGVILAYLTGALSRQEFLIKEQ